MALQISSLDEIVHRQIGSSKKVIYLYIVAFCVIKVYEHPIRFVFGFFPLFLDHLPMTRFSKLTKKDIPSPLAAVGNIILKGL